MARTGSGALLCRRNMKLDSFLKRNTERAVYERIRAYEPCVVKSDTINKVYMHVVLSDERVYLTEYPPRTLTSVVSFSRMRDLELVNDLPDFLSGKDRELCQHIRILYVTDKLEEKGCDWKDDREGLPPAAPPSRRISHCPSMQPTLDGKDFGYFRIIYWIVQAVFAIEHIHTGTEHIHTLKTTRSASCPDSETLGLLMVPYPPTHPPSTAAPFKSTSSSPTSPRTTSSQSLKTSERIGSVLSRLLRKNSSEAKEVELHLYAVSPTSKLYFHLQSSWNSFIIRSTLLLDPLYRRRYYVSSGTSTGKQLPVISWERTAHLFGQLSAELLQEGLSMESLYLLLQELRTAAHRNITLRKLFWRSSELCIFLVQTLEDSLHGTQTGVYTTDQLLLSTLIVQTLAVMFRETDVEPARFNLLSAKKGALTSRMLLALICDPELQTQNQGSATDSELQAFLAEYLDAACSLFFELLLLGHEVSLDRRGVNTNGLIKSTLSLQLSFIGYQAQQVVLSLSDPQDVVLSPVHSVLLFQRCRLLLAGLQYSTQMSKHLQSHFREEFRYSVNLSCLEKKLPPQYPISPLTQRLVEQILNLILH
uniref:Si:ch211-258f14.2 n=1 Tax=Sphaeramia orbicularis TaxID=375764 RepID=A0A673ALZ4_9TELE